MFVRSLSKTLGLKLIYTNRFHDQSFVITQNIYKIGLEQFERRSSEHKLFVNCVTVGKKKIQVQGQQ